MASSGYKMHPGTTETLGAEKNTPGKMIRKNYEKLGSSSQAKA
jgi:hypothetical protein